MPSKDFGSPEIFKFSDGDVTVESVSVVNQLDFIVLEKRNRKTIDSFRIVIDNVRTLNSFGIYFDGVPVGEVTVWTYIPSSDVCLSFWVDDAFQRKGVGSSAVRLVSKFVLDTYSSDVVAHALLDNVGSISLLKKLGFVPNGTIVFNTASGMKLHGVFVLRSDNASL